MASPNFKRNMKTAWVNQEFGETVSLETAKQNKKSTTVHQKSDNNSLAYDGGTRNGYKWIY